MFNEERYIESLKKDVTVRIFELKKGLKCNEKTEFSPEDGANFLVDSLLALGFKATDLRICKSDDGESTRKNPIIVTDRKKEPLIELSNATLDHKCFEFCSFDGRGDVLDSKSTVYIRLNYKESDELSPICMGVIPKSGEYFDDDPREYFMLKLMKNSNIKIFNRESLEFMHDNPDLVEYVYGDSTANNATWSENGKRLDDVSRVFSKLLYRYFLSKQEEIHPIISKVKRN